MLPDEKRLVARLKDKPFALIGINSDGERCALLKIMHKQGITWRNIVDGHLNGPVASRWNVHQWPTLYLLDSKGVIRYIDVRGKEMEKAVMLLLKEIK